MLVKKDDSTQGLILSAGRDVAFTGEMGQESVDLCRSHIFGVAHAVEPNESRDPVDIGVFGADGVVAQPDLAATVHAAHVLAAHTLHPQLLVEDIALLIWKKARLDRAEAAVQVRNLQKHDLERRKQFIQVGREISDTLHSEVRDKGLRRTLDAPGKFEQILSIAG